MDLLTDRSVLLVASNDARTPAFGTAFFAGRDSDGVAYVITCAHVVRDVGGPAAVTIGGRPAQLVIMGPPEGANDIAVLKTDVPGDALPLPLSAAPAGRGTCSVMGYRRLYGTVRSARRIHGVFGSALLTTDGRHVAGWNLEMDEQVPDGYSGSPVFDGTTGEVIGIASLSFINVAGAVAIAAQEVTALWPGYASLKPPRLTVRDVEFVYVPAGSFAMGTPDRRAQELAEQRGRPEFVTEAPRSEIPVDAFYIARYPVTNEQYQQFVDESGEPVPFRRTDPWSSRYSWDPVTRRFPRGLERHPAVLISWTRARRYCHWLGGRLPTEAEWEKAARGPDGRTWPWGDEWRADNCNTAEHAAEGTTLVGAYSPNGDSPYGAADMSGNVWEWCSSLSDPYPYDADDGREDQGTESRRVLRGGAFEQDRFMARCATRNAAHQDDRGFTIGVRPVLLPRAGAIA
jgi:toxoflavin biosynthesis protein ToxD